MPMLLSELDSVCEGDPNIMSGIGFSATSQRFFSDFSAVAKPSFVLDTLDDMFAADWDWPIKHEWDDMDELVAAGEGRLSDSPHLSHDCMWSGTCFSDDHRENRTFHERKCHVRTSVKSSADPAANCSASSNSTSASSNTSRCENNSSIAGSSSASSAVATASCPSSSINGVVNSSILTVTAASSCSGSSSSVSKVSNSSACVINSNNVINSSINSSVVVSSSSSSVSCKSLVERTTTTCVSQKQTIQVPSVGGPRRAGVTVQKTVARSLLIKPSKAPEPPAPAPIIIPPAPYPVALVRASTAPIVACSPAVAAPLPSLPILPTTITTVPLPTPVVAAAIKRTCYQPETPAESEDPCPLDLPLPSALLNSFLIDNIKTPQGDLWDDVMAAVEEETAAGLIPETPPPSSKASSDSESCDENSFQPPATFPMMAPSTPLHSSDSGCEAATASSSSESPVSIVNDDHSYHSSAKYGWQRRLDDLGLQTPSDSEEEIDVVSTFERSSNYSSGRSSTCSSPGSSSDSSSVPDKHSTIAEAQELQLAATKLLSEASRAVSKRLRLKLSTSGKPRGRPPTKRRLSNDLDDDDSSVTRLPKKAKAHGGRLKKSRFTEEFGDRRRLHNNMERMRRVDLRNSFEDLRGLVPSLMNKERAPKVLILQDAANFCTELKIQSKQLSTEVFALKKEQERLRATVSGLRRSLAAYR